MSSDAELAGTRARRRLRAHVVAVASGDGLTRVLGGLATMVLARTLGGEAFGVLELALGIFAYFQLAAVAGLDWTGMRMIARGRESAEAVADLVVLRFAVAAVGVVALVTLAAFLPMPRVSKLLFGFAALLPLAAGNLRWVFLAEERGQPVALLATAGQLVFVGSIVAAVHEPSDLVRVPVLRFVAELTVVAGLVAAFARRRPRLDLRGRAQGWPALVRQSLPLGFTRVVGQAIFNADVVLLGAFGLVGQVGYYGAAYRVVLLLQVLPESFFTALFPTLAREYAGAPTVSAADRAATTVFLSLALTLPLSFIIADRSAEIVTAVYGASFRPSAEPLRILVCVFPLVTTRAIFRNLLVASGQEIVGLWLALGTALGNIALNLALIPRLGLIGAALATVGSEAFLLAASVSRVRSSLGAPALAKPAAGPLLGLVAMGTVALYCRAWAATPRLACALVAYALAVLATRRVCSPER